MGASIRRRLLWLILGMVTIVWLGAGWRVYEDARHEVDEVYDANLAQSARVLLGLLAHEVEEEGETRDNIARVVNEVGLENLANFPVMAGLIREHSGATHEHIEWAERGNHPGHKYESKLALLARYGDGEILLISPNAPKVPQAKDGFSDFNDGGRRWRFFSIVDGATGLLVQVGERIEVRRELVGYITRNAVLPLVIALPLLALLLWLAVGQGLRPLARVADEVGHRKPDALHAIPLEDSPCEVRPLLDSLNSLFVRLDRALQAERRFTADAAHELRTPLAALRTQAQVAVRETDPGRRAQALANIQQGVDRATHLVEQLLTLARADAGSNPKTPLGPVAIGPLVAELLAEMVDDAMAHGAEIGFDNGGGEVAGDPGALRILARNLIDNAVRYGGEGVHITVATRQVGEQVELEVLDDGPGIPAADRERVLERFHRGDAVTLFADAKGSGLGLSIVQRIAEMHRAVLRLDEGPDGRGLRVQLRFPARA